MKINKKILLLTILFLVIFSNVAYAQMCAVQDIKDMLRRILYFYLIQPEKVPFTIDEIKDLVVFYLTIGRNEQSVDCSVLGTKSKKPIFDIIYGARNITDKIPKCFDGTKYGECSGNRPEYCYQGSLLEKCDVCGCPSNSICGKSGKCESTIQNITCHNDIDCGKQTLVGDYYCSYNSVYRNVINYTCVSPGTANSSCMAVNGSVWLAYCYPSLNQICVDGQSTCQTNTTDAAPTVSITVSPTSVAQGQTFNVTVTGTDDIGLAAIWWWAVDSTDTELNKAHWYSCYNAKYCSNSWLVSTSAVGTIKLGANSRDTSYPVAGEPHQASEGAGIAYATVTVGTAGNVTGGLPDIIISDFKSYTGTTNTYVTISATIKNIGGSVTEGNLCDSLYVETLNARGFCGAKLNPGETRVIQSDYALPMPGTYKIRADTDYGVLVAESNENNNVAWQTITVTSPYSADYAKANTDLTVADIDVQLPTASSEQTKVYVTTKNLGSLATGQYWVYTKVTNQDTGAVTKVQRLAPVVQPGGTYKTYHGEVGIKEHGTYKVEAFVDINLYGGAYIYESNEDNNYLSKTVVYGVNVTITESVSLQNLSVVDGNLIAEYSKNFATCAHLLTSNSQITHVQNYYCTEGSNIVVSQPISSFNVTTGQSYKLCHGNNYNICSALRTLENLTVPTVSCIDSDGGLNYYVKGSATAGTTTQYDTCKNQTGSNLVEGFCDGNVPKGYPYMCPYGCQDGACVNATTTGCVDSDDTGNLYWGTGKNYYVKGYCNSTNGIFYDECSDSTVREAFCSNLDCAYYDYSCGAYGCQDGACICPAPYHVLSDDGRCVWSCGVGTTPSSTYPFECVCKPSYVESGEDSFGRRVCVNQTTNNTNQSGTIFSPNSMRSDAVTGTSVLNYNYPIEDAYIYITKGMEKNYAYGSRQTQLSLSNGGLYVLNWDYNFANNNAREWYYSKYGTGAKPNHLSVVISNLPVNRSLNKELDIEIRIDEGVTKTVYFPSIPTCPGTNHWRVFYISKDGSTYYSRSDHQCGYAGLSPEEAIVSQHLARAAP